MFTPSKSTVPADWIASSGKPMTYDVRGIVGADFPAYARVFHPAERWSGGPEPVRWSVVAAANGRIMHAAAEWGSLVGSWREASQPGLWNQEPARGAPPRETVAALIAVVGDPDEPCWFGAWEGYGGGVQPSLASAVKFAVPGRNLLLLSGPLLAATSTVVPEPWWQPPNMWWPDSRAWCVASDIDLMTTYVGGSRETIDRILAADGIEALPVRAEQRVTWDADQINPLPDPPY